LRLDSDSPAEKKKASDMTITSPTIVKAILRNNGADEDMTFASIYEYRSVGGKEILYALFSDHQFDDIFRSPYVNPSSVVLLFTRENGLTEAGKSLLQQK